MGSSRRSATDSGIKSARVASTGDAAFNISFTLARPGTLHFLVVYASLMGRYVDTLVAWDNTPTDPVALLASDLADFAGGTVARGSCSGLSAGVPVSCRFGPATGGDEGAAATSAGHYACSPAVSCRVQNACFGSLCDYSRYGMAPNATFKVCYYGLGSGAIAGERRASSLPRAAWPGPGSGPRRGPRALGPGPGGGEVRAPAAQVPGECAQPRPRTSRGTTSTLSNSRCHVCARTCAGHCSAAGRREQQRRQLAHGRGHVPHAGLARGAATSVRAARQPLHWL